MYVYCRNYTVKSFVCKKIEWNYIFGHKLIVSALEPPKVLPPRVEMKLVPQVMFSAEAHHSQPNNLVPVAL